MHIINLSELPPEWLWLERSFPAPHCRWSHFSTQSIDPPRLLKSNTARRWMAASRAISAAGSAPDLLVSHGPAMTAYAELAAMTQGRRPRHHLAYTFNFTDLPTGAKRSVMARAYRKVHRFGVFSTLETRLYADYLDLPIERFTMLRWAVNPPDIAGQSLPLYPGDYVCAVGSQARNYPLLMTAARRLPAIKFVIVATQDSLSTTGLPENVTVLHQVPLTTATNVLLHSRFMVLPLRHDRQPCGHVTLVSAMHLGKAIVATRSEGISDYVQHGFNALIADPEDPDQLAQRIRCLYEEPAHCASLGGAGQRFAQEFCTESVTTAFFQHYLTEIAEKA